MRILTFLLIALLGLPSLADENANFAGFLTVQVEGVPKETSSAYLSLDKHIELELVQSADGVWRGNFLLLPDFYQGLPTPVVSLKDERGNVLPSSNLKQHLASSTLQAAKLALALRAENVSVVVDSRVRNESVKLLTREGREVKPVFREHSFTLPLGLNPGSVVAVSGIGVHGRELVFQAPLDVNVASPLSL